MKKRFKMIFGLLLTLVFVSAINAYAETPTLEQIANAFNNSPQLDAYTQANVTYQARAGENKIIVTSEVGTAIAAYEYPVEGTIISHRHLNDDRMEAENFSIWFILIDSIGKLYGYDYGELYRVIMTEEIKNYTLENEGYEMKENEAGKYDCKADLSKKIPLMDFSDTFIAVSDLDDLKDFISGNGSAESSRGNVWFNKSGYDGKNTLLVAEKSALTDNAYKSILSILTVMFNSTEAVEHFKKNYPTITTETKKIKGMTIEYNPTKTEFESRLIPDSYDYKFLRIKINKDEYLEGMRTSSSTTTPTKPSVVKVPNTAKGVQVKMLLVGILLILAGVGVAYFGLRNQEEKQEL